ncbi:MAG TPA: DAK2 domain-containing protein [Nocardioidaceae bacterium]|nr:DAK2 domain-containing protein [Nocardioidaceae bacterium]
MEFDAASFTPPLLVALSEEVVRCLSSAREELDALNVFPVPDGDTGTNMFLTFEGAHTELVALLKESPETPMPRAVATFNRALLFAARGNSGVIMSQLFGAMVRRLVEPSEERFPVKLAAAMTAATEAGYAAVGEPVEGTILTVMRAASDAALVAAERPDATVVRVLRAAASAARDALDKTPEQLMVLRNAGVVDAGGRGLCVVLDAIETALTGKRPVDRYAAVRRPLPMPIPADDLTEDGPAYEVMYLLDATDDAIPELKQRLHPLGDSLVVVGGEGLWNVHVHVDDVGAAIEAGIVAGRPHRVRVTHFAEQIAAMAAGKGIGKPKPERRGRRVVVVAYGTGLAEVFRAAGATVVMAMPGERPSTQEIYDAVVATGAAEVMVMPNDGRATAAAEAATHRAQESLGLRASMIGTTAQVQALAALAVHEPGRTFEQDLVEMTAAARHARSGAITVADKAAMTMAGPCEPGDVLGIVEGDFAIVGEDQFAVATGVLDRMIGGGGELVTIVAGADARDLADRCAAYVESSYVHVDVVEYDGGQARYPLLFGVE